MDKDDFQAKKTAESGKNLTRRFGMLRFVRRRRL